MAKLNKPTDAELAILNVLWERGPSTVRQVQEALKDRRQTGYTTTLKLMQIMLEKALVKRDDSSHAHVYRAALTRGKTQRQLIGKLVDQVFEGSAQQLVMQALSSHTSSPAELAEIKRLIEDLEKAKQ